MEPIEVEKIVREVRADLRAQKAEEYARRFRREEIRAGLHELWPSFFPIQPLPERIARAEAEVERLKKKAAKR